MPSPVPKHGGFGLRERIGRDVDLAFTFPVFLATCEAIEVCAHFPCRDWFSRCVFGYHVMVLMSMFTMSDS